MIQVSYSSISTADLGLSVFLQLKTTNTQLLYPSTDLFSGAEQSLTVAILLA